MKNERGNITTDPLSIMMISKHFEQLYVNTFLLCRLTEWLLWYHKLPKITQKGISSVQSHGHLQIFATTQTAAYQVSLSITNSWSLLKLMSTKSVMPSIHLILHCPLLLPPSIFPSIRVFSMSQFITSGVQSIGVSASASVLPMNIQD